MRVLAAGFTEQASVTNWPVRVFLVGVMFVIIALVLWAMLRGWRAREGRQADIPVPQEWKDASEADSSAVLGLYVGTSTAGHWLDRIAVHGLGVRSRAEVSLSANGVGIRREGAPSFLIPARDLRGVRTDRGVAGTVRAKDSVIILTWQLGPRLVDTGFRADEGTDHRTLLDGLMAAFPTCFVVGDTSTLDSLEGDTP
jgi:hypothetical protein